MRAQERKVLSVSEPCCMGTVPCPEMPQQYWPSEGTLGFAARAKGAILAACPIATGHSDKLRSPEAGLFPRQRYPARPQMQGQVQVLVTPGKTSDCESSAAAQAAHRTML